MSPRYLCAPAAAALFLAACQATPPAVSRVGEGNFTIGPNYTDAPEMTVPPAVPKGTITEFVMDSHDSKIYPGVAKNKPGVTPYTRKVSVYLPAGYKPGTPLPFIECQDGLNKGMGYCDALPPALDNLIAQKRIPPMAAILIDSGGDNGAGSQRGLEYDTVSGRYSDFFEEEVLPRVTKETGATFTTDPEGRATMGGSSGAACAFSMAWFHPERYHRVLSYSGTFINQQFPVNPETPHGAWEYHANLIPKAEPKPIRIWMHVSENDVGAKDPETGFRNWVAANHHMADIFKEKGYHYRFEYALKSGHVDVKVLRQTLPSALEWLWQGYSAK